MGDNIEADILRNSHSSFTELGNPSCDNDHDESCDEEEECVDADMVPMLPTDPRPELSLKSQQ